MTKIPSDRKPRRVPRQVPPREISPEEKTRIAAERKERYQHCRAIFERVRPQLIKDYYNWYIVIEANSGDYFLEKDYMVVFQKLCEKQQSGNFVTFRLNETGTCGTI